MSSHTSTYRKNTCQTSTCLILYGPPMSGKGTLAHLLSLNMSADHLDAGGVIRSSLQDPKLMQRINEGHLLDDAQVISMVDKRIREAKENLIVDGFPRSLGQARHLLKYDRRFALVKLDISLEAALRRMERRVICPQCGRTDSGPPPHPCGCGCSNWTKRKDDKREVLEKRYSDYHRYSQEILDFYRDKIEVWTFSGLLSPQVLAPSIQEALRRMRDCATSPPPVEFD